MKSKLYFLGLLIFLLFGCRSKKIRTFEQNEQQTQQVIKNTDSLFKTEKRQNVNILNLENLQNFELELETEKDSLGNSKELIFEHQKEENKETIKVKNGKVKVKKKLSKREEKKDTLHFVSEKKQVSITENQLIQTSKTQKIKEKEVKIGWAKIVFAIIFSLVSSYFILKRK
jgi:hypothetical protein